MSLKRKKVQRVVKFPVKVDVKWKLEKFNAKNSKEIEEKNLQPFEVIEQEIPDVLLHEGIIAMFYHIAGIGTSCAKWDNTNARIGVGTDSTAPADTQSGLLGTTAFAGMNASYPQQSGDHDLVFQADFGDGVAEFAWNEETIDNGSGDDDNLCRQNTALGTKPAGQTWRLTGTVTFT
jgi:hypothetical protein